MAALTGQAVYESSQTARRDRSENSAVLVENAPRSALAAADRGNVERVNAKVRWRDHSGVVHTGVTRVEPGRAAGARITVWTDRKGHLVPAPPGPFESVMQTGFVSTTAAAAFCALILFGRRAARIPLDRRRANQWAREWVQVGPQWGRRRT